MLPIEEAVRRARVDDDLVLHPGFVEGLVERVHVLHWDPRIVAAHQREDRRLHVRRPLRRPGQAVVTHVSGPRAPVEADRAG